MGNALINPCFRPSSTVKLISYGGATTILTGKNIAGEITFQFPDHVICPADSFYIGRPIPSLAIDDELITGQTYFLLPLDCFPQNAVLSTAVIAGLGRSGQNNNQGGAVVFKECPFEYVRGSDGRCLIKVVPEFITRLISRDNYNISNNNKEIKGEEGSGGFLCSTPELQKHYDQLVGCKDRVWSPKLETISESKVRFSPCRFIGLEWKVKEVEG